MGVQHSCACLQFTVAGLAVSCMLVQVGLSPCLLLCCSMPRLGFNRMDAYSVLDYGEKSVVHCEDVPCHPNVAFPKHFDDTLEGDHLLAMWTASQAKAKYAFLCTILENSEGKRASYLCLALNE